MPINATFHGYIETTTDSLLLFEACRRGVLPKISRRLQERERGSVKSGTVYIFDEKESGIKRWTDGLIWSPSRILGNFLIYRELGGRESLNDKNSVQDSYHSHHYAHDSQYMPSHNHMSYQENVQESVDEEYVDDMTAEERNKERNLVGSLTDTYKFRKGGLIKKTLSIQLNGCTQHLISYYTKEDVLKCRLATPSSISEISCLQISPGLLLKQSFRVPPSAEFAELMSKKPSLSPSSTTTSSSISSSSTQSHQIKRNFNRNANYHHPYSPSLHHHHQQYSHSSEDNDLSLYHSRRPMLESSSTNTKKYYRTSFDNDSPYRSSSFYNQHPLDNSSQEGRELNLSTSTSFRALYGIDNNSSISNAYETTNSYQNVNGRTASNSPISPTSSNNLDIQQQRRFSSISSRTAFSLPATSHFSHQEPSPKLIRHNSYSSSSISSPSSTINYQQRSLHDIPAIPMLSPPYHQQAQQQGANYTSRSPFLSPSRFLWSDNENLGNDQNAKCPPSSSTSPSSVLPSRAFISPPPSSHNSDYCKTVPLPVSNLASSGPYKSSSKSMSAFTSTQQQQDVVYYQQDHRFNSSNNKMYDNRKNTIMNSSVTR